MYKFYIGTRIMSSARARGLATQPPENTPEREDLLLVRAFALGQMKAHGVSPLRESDTAPPLAVSKDVVAETLSRSENTETDLSACVTIGDEVSPLTIDTSIPVSTENSGSLHKLQLCAGCWRRGGSARSSCWRHTRIGMKVLEGVESAGPAAPP